jgi:hypothetical protein
LFPPPDEVTGFPDWPNPSNCIKALRFLQPLTEMGTRNLPWGKVWLACKPVNLNGSMNYKIIIIIMFGIQG